MSFDSSSKNIYRIGAWFTVFVLIGIVVDIIFGTVTGGNIAELPQTAVGRFEQLHNNRLLGLYNLDLLNIINQLLLIPGYIALYVVHREKQQGYAFLALVVFLVGTVIIVINNSALAMLDLSRKYFAASGDQKMLIAAAGEALLVKGEHGGLNVFIGFILPNVSGLIISMVMWKEKIFGKWTAVFGIIGSVLISLYVILVTFAPAIKSMATAFAAPGGILLLAWMILFTRTLFRLSGNANNKTH